MPEHIESSPDTRQAPLRATRVAILVSLLLAGVKLATGIMTGSLALLSSGVDSIIDIFKCCSGVVYQQTSQGGGNRI
ncbi:MAG: cation transporter [Geobacteraceae bacterium]|nr:cation transporter [Geobacteraceae bacterium]